jgi:hypothetical protein
VDLFGWLAAWEIADEDRREIEARRRAGGELPGDGPDGGCGCVACGCLALAILAVVIAVALIL